MHIKGLGLGGLVAIVALVGCGSSSGTGGTGGNTGKGGSTGTAGSTGMAGGTGTAGRAGGGGSTGSGGSIGSGGSGAPFSTSVPSGTKLTGLTSGQATQLCTDIGNYVDHTFFMTLCNASGPLNGLDAAYLDLLLNPSAPTAELRAACTAAEADAGSCSGSLDGGAGTCNVSSIPSTCQATVGDYTKCINDSTTADVQFYASLPSCSTLTAASLNALFAADGGVGLGPMEPTSCSMFDSTCSVDAGTAAMTNMSPLPMPRRQR